MVLVLPVLTYLYCFDHGSSPNDPESIWRSIRYSCHPGSLPGLTRPTANRSFGYARSEERRVGKECTSRWSPYPYKKKNTPPPIRTPPPTIHTPTPTPPPCRTSP